MVNAEHGAKNVQKMKHQGRGIKNVEHGQKMCFIHEAPNKCFLTRSSHLNNRGFLASTIWTITSLKKDKMQFINVILIASLFILAFPLNNQTRSFPHKNILAIMYQYLLGNSRKYPYPTTDGFHVLTPPPPLAFGNSKMRYPPMPSEFHNSEPPLPFRISGFSGKYIFNFSNAYMNKRT